jgi:ribosome biogenesis GTPase
MSIDLERYGWSSFFANQFGVYSDQGCLPGRVAVQRKTNYLLVTAGGEVQAHIAGKLRYTATNPADLPAVGDWVAFRGNVEGGSAIILGVLERKSKFSRNAAGRSTVEQVVASNVDIVFLVHALDDTPNLRGIERYLVVAIESGARPVVLLHKADLCENSRSRLDDVRAVVGDTDVYLTSAQQPDGLSPLLRYLQPGITGALLGASGVGKSTIINTLLGEARLKTNAVRIRDGKGRHTTSQRELVSLDGGGLLIDTPGMRELQLWDGDSGVDETFDDIESLVADCRFRDCRHETEPGCAVLAAVASGMLDTRRLESFRKLRRETEYHERKYDVAAKAAEKARWKAIAKARKREKRG